MHFISRIAVFVPPANHARHRTGGRRKARNPGIVDKHMAGAAVHVAAAGAFQQVVVPFERRQQPLAHQRFQRLHGACRIPQTESHTAGG